MHETPSLFCLFQASSLVNVPVIVPILSFFCSSFDVRNEVLPFLFLTIVPFFKNLVLSFLQPCSLNPKLVNLPVFLPYFKYDISSYL